MEPNQQAAAQAAPAAQPMNVTEEPVLQNHGSGGKLKFMLIILLIVAVLAAGGYYLYQLNMGQSATSRTQSIEQAVTALNQLQSEVNALEVGSTDTEFTDVDQDLQSL